MFNISHIKDSVEEAAEQRNKSSPGEDTVYLQGFWKGTHQSA